MKRNLWNKPFTETEVQHIMHLLKVSGMAEFAVAQKYNVTQQEIRNIRRSLAGERIAGHWSRAKQLIEVGEPSHSRLMSISDIAAAAGVTRTTIYMRLYRGVTGPMLLSKTHTLPRLKKGSLTERLGRVRKIVRPSD